MIGALPGARLTASRSFCFLSPCMATVPKPSFQKAFCRYLSKGEPGKQQRRVTYREGRGTRSAFSNLPSETAWMFEPLPT